MASPKSTPAPTAQALDALVEFDALDMLARSLPLGLGLGCLPLAISVIVLSRVSDAAPLSAWAVAVATALAVGLALAARYRRSAPAVGDTASWRRRFMLMTALVGLAWGSSAWLLLPAPREVELLLSLLLAVTAASIMGDLAASPLLFVALVVPMLLPLALVFIRRADLVDVALGVGALAYGAALAMFARRTGAAIHRSLRVGHENRRLAHALAERTRDVERASAAKSRFLAAASHDLRQPVHALGLLLDVLQGQALNPAQQRTAQRIARAVDALDDLFGSLLDISRLDGGAVEVRGIDFALRPLLLRLADEYRSVADAKGLRLRCRAGDDWVHSDPLLLERIVRNLLANAVHYTRRGGIVIGCRRRGGRLDIEVWDSGIGIAPELQAHVFDEFFQVGNPQRDRSQGLGLGLAIVRRLAALLQHPVGLRSRPGRGSVFSIGVALAPAGPPPPAVAAAAPSPAVEGRRHVLVVDDDRLVREALHSGLSSWGCDVTAYPDAESLLDRMTDLHPAPDALITDWRLPGSADGLLLAQRLRQHFGAGLPVIVVTGDALAEPRLLAALGRATLLYKPVRAAELRAALAAAWLPAAATVSGMPA